MSRLERGSLAYGDVNKERRRAAEKHAGPENREEVPWTDPLWLPILVEEVGEVAHVLTMSGFAPMPNKLRGELVQVAAMACAWIDAIDEANHD